MNEWLKFQEARWAFILAKLNLKIHLRKQGISEEDIQKRISFYISR